MVKQLKKNLSLIIITTFVMAFAYMLVAPVSVNAADPNALLWGNQLGAVNGTIGLGAKDPRIIAAALINVILGFLGIIATVIILLGGFKWMTAGGNEDKIGEAKGLMTAGFIGLLIILASWGIAKFVVNLLFNATQ